MPADERVAALAFFGLLPRWDKKFHDNKTEAAQAASACAATLDSLRALEHNVLPITRYRVVQPATSKYSGFSELHVYGHTWELTEGCGCKSELPDVLKRTLSDMNGVKIKSILSTPRPRELPKDYGWPPQQNMSWQNVSDVWLRDRVYLSALVSIKWVLALVRGQTIDGDYPTGDRNPPWWDSPLSAKPPTTTGGADVVVLMRWDAIFYTQFAWGELNWSLFYRANWCIVNVHDEQDDNGCKGLLPFKGSYRAMKNHCGGGDVPDYYFASNATVMHRVFDDALEDLASFKFQGGRCAVLHGFLLGRIQYLQQHFGILVGRYKYLGLDSEFYRSHLWDPTRRAFHDPALSSSWKSLSSKAARRIWDGQSHERDGSPHHVDYSYDIREPRDESVCSPGPRFCGCLAVAQLQALVGPMFTGKRPSDELPHGQQCTDVHLKREEQSQATSKHVSQAAAEAPAVSTVQVQVGQHVE